MKILNFGSLNVDHTYRVDAFVRPGETKASLGYVRGCGGKGLNQSIALALAGAGTYHAGLVGEDAGFLRERLLRAGVDCTYLYTSDRPNGHAVIQVDEHGQNCILLYSGTNGALTKEQIDATLSRFERGDLLLLQNETNLVPYLIEQAWERGLRVALNAAPMTPAVKTYPLEKLTWLLVNETEGADLTGETEPEALEAWLLTRYPALRLVLTLGAEGCRYAAEGVRLAVPAMKVRTIDTTGAGDTFTGYFLAAVARGEMPEAALKLATAASALAVTRPGAADSVPSLREVQAFLQKENMK